MNDGQLNPQGQTSDQIKERIDQMRRDMKQTQSVGPDSATNGTSPDLNDKTTESAQSKANEAPQPTPKQETASSAKAEQAVGSPIAPAPKADKREVDIREWAKKKGIKDEESALRSLRDLERKLHEKSYQEKVKGEAPAPVWQPTPQMAPPQLNFPTYQAPQYQPPDRRRIIEEEAAKRNMLPEDFEKVLDVANEVSRIQTERMRQELKAQYDSQLYEITRENRRNSELRELMTDPLFTNPEVQFEMHQVLEDNPKALELEPAPYTYAFNEAQRRLARRFLQDSQSTEQKSGSLPNRPPSEGGRGSSLSQVSGEDNLKEKFFNAKTAEEKAKILTSIGARPTL